jgi:PKD repeat protein
MYFAVHGDGTGDTAANWSVSAIPTGWSPDDHINLKVDPNGNIFAAVKTSESSGANPLVLLLKRTLTNATTGSGTWSTAIYGRVSDSHTRPIVLLDPTNNMVHMFATCPQPPLKSGQSGGNICEKTASMSSPSFPTGIGTAVIQDHTSTDMNDVTSTRQNVSPATGLVVLANDKTTHLYWHADESLGGGGGPTAPTADFTATPTSGTAPLVVQFTSTSTGSPTSYSWDFGDGTPAGTGANPTHTYAAGGPYTVSLTATNATGSNTKTQTNLITVGTAPNPGGDKTFNAVADAPVKSTSVNNNYGGDTSLRVRQGTSATDTTYHTYVKFDVTGVAGTVTGAKLRLYVTDASPDGGRVFPVASTWTETGLTYGNAPTIPAASVGSAGVTTAGGYVDINLGTAVTGNGTYSFALTNTSSNSAYYSSREGANPPQLVLSTDGGGTPGPGALTADFSGTPTAGTGTLTTTFTDLTTGGADGWTWDFGDSTAVSTAQNPTHTYGAPGTYTVTLTAARSADGASSVKTRSGYIVVSPTQPPPSGGTLTFNPLADAHVKNTSTGTNYGTATTLQVRQGDASNNTTYVSYLKFAVTGVNGAPVSSAKLRLYVTDASTDGGSVFRVDDTWTETGLTWATRPVLPATSIGNAGNVAAGGYVDIDLGTAVTGDGTYSFAVQSSSTNSAIYASKESTNKPQLVLGV